MLLINKNFAKLSINQLISKFNTDLEVSIEKIKSLTEKYSIVDLTEKIPPPFTLSKGATKAIELLNDGLYAKIFDKNIIPYEDILMTYRLYFYIFNKPEIAEISDSFFFWAKCCDYFNNLSQIGKKIFENIYTMNFSNENILKLQKVLGNNHHKITPTYYSKLCGTTGLFLFLIKDAFEYCGILVDAKKTPPYNLYKNEKFIVDKLQTLIDSLRNIQLILKL